MGQIEEALRKAKEVQANVTPGQKQFGRAVRSRGTGFRADDSAPLKSLLTAKTRVITLDREVMEGNRIVTGSQNSGPTSTYKMLRTRMLQRLRTNNWSRIAICSPRASAGKTLTAINTAISLSHEPNQQVVLVDFDLRRPTVAKYLGIEREKGLSDYLAGDVEMEDVICRTNIDRFMVVPNHEKYDNSSEMLSSNKLVELVNVLSGRQNSSIVLFDLPPLLDADDLLAFAPQFDAVLLVVAEGETRRADLQKSAELIGDMNVVGFVLNKARSEDFATGYY